MNASSVTVVLGALRLTGSGDLELAAECDEIALIQSQVREIQEATDTEPTTLTADTFPPPIEVLSASLRFEV